MTRTAVRRTITTVALVAGTLAVALPAQAGRSWASAPTAVTAHSWGVDASAVTGTKWDALDAHSWGVDASAVTGTKWDTVRWGETPTPCLTDTEARKVVDHTFSRTRMTVTVPDGQRLCTPVTLSLAAYTFDGPGMWPQTLAHHQTLAGFDHGTASLIVPAGCGQTDGLIGPPKTKLTGPGQDGTFVSSALGAPLTYDADAPADCVVKPTPTVTPPVVTPPAVVVPTPSQTVAVPAATPARVSQAPQAPTAPQIAAQPAVELPVTGAGKILAWVLVALVLLLVGVGTVAAGSRGRRHG
jgi:hypothetical protein